MLKDEKSKFSFAPHVTAKKVEKFLPVGSVVRRVEEAATQGF